MKAIAAISILIIGLLSGSCDRATKAQFEEGEQEQIGSIAALKALYTGETMVVRSNIAIKGVVTGNDLYGEFHKMLVIEDTSGGITIAIDGTNLADDFPVGAAITLYCNGLTLGDYGGKVQIGGASEGDYSVGRIPHAELPRYLRRNNTLDEQMPRPITTTFGAIGQQQIDTFVQFDEVRFAESGAWCDLDPETSRPMTTERLLIDLSGKTFTLRTAGTCTYAEEPVPQGTGSISGIIDYFNGKYTLHVSGRRLRFPTVAGLPTAYP